MPGHPPCATILQHVAFEDLGSLQPVLERRGFRIDYRDAATSSFDCASSTEAELAVILGGPIGVYETDEYPFLKEEMHWIKSRLEQRRPTLGICLGAQLMAAALGAAVYAGSHGAEIGWAPLQPVADLHVPGWFKPLLQPGLQLFHWHGDTFDLPAGATHLAATEMYANQAFTLGDYGLALQFHPEVTRTCLERWYVGHTNELHTRHIKASDLRRAGQMHCPALEAAAQVFWNQWLDYIL